MRLYDVAISFVDDTRPPRQICVFSHRGCRDRILVLVHMRVVGVDDEESAKAFERAFSKIVPPKRRVQT